MPNSELVHDIVIGGGAFSLGLIAAGIPGPAAAIAFNDLPAGPYRGTMGVPR
jgi:hypothetical protein